MLNIETVRRELKDQPEVLAQFETLVASGALKNELTDSELECITAGKDGGRGGPGRPRPPFPRPFPRPR